jgi:hypothetical protein
MRITSVIGRLPSRAPPRMQSTGLRCSRMGGEAVSLALKHSQAALFRAMPYQPLEMHDQEPPQKGRVREYGNLSFVVVYDAGHFVPAEKPDVALELLKRAISGMDLATGLRPISNVTLPFPADTPVSRTLSAPPSPTGNVT